MRDDSGPLPGGAACSPFESRALPFLSCPEVGRQAHVVNLDPAADAFHYEVAADVRELVSLSDVMEELSLGPNGGLLYCMEFLENRLDDWLSEALDCYGEEEYLMLDCPGQIELYSHSSCMRTVANWLACEGFKAVCVYLLDSSFVIADASKFIAGCTQVLAAMLQLELPHISVLSKIDLLVGHRVCLDKYLAPDARLLSVELDESMGPKLIDLNTSIAQVLEDYDIVSFTALDATNEESIAACLQQIDMAVQFGEEAEVKASKDLPGKEQGE